MDKKNLEKKWSEQAMNMKAFHMKELYERGGIWNELLKESLSECSGKKALDVGCGTGFLAILLAKIGWFVTAIDTNLEMLEAGKVAANELGLSDKIEFLTKDAHQSGFSDNSFDAVVSRHAFWLFLEPKKIYGEWKRLLKPYGTALNMDANWYFPLWNDEAAKKFRADEAELIKLYGEFKDYYHDSEMMSYMAKLPLAYRKRPEWDIGICRELGFKDIEVKRLSEDKYWNCFYAKRYSTMPTFLIKMRKGE